MIEELNTKNSIPEDFRDTPIAKLIAYHNFKQEFNKYDQAQLLIGMCMDHRKHLNIPTNFSYIIRTGGANLRYNDFQIAYTISIAGIKHMALIAHTDCGMSNLLAKKDSFVAGLSNKKGWDKDRATVFFDQSVDKYNVGNGSEFILEEAARIKQLFPELDIATLLYKVEDHLLYWVK